MRKNRSRFLALCLSVSLIATALMGCGADVTTSTTQETEQEVTQETNTTTTEVSKETSSVEKIDITTFSLPEQAEESSIYIEPIPGISDDFIRGMDASIVLVNENSGAKYYNYEGEEQDVFMTMAQAGINYIRLRVWNDPFDENGNGYGGGNNDVATAIELGKRATQYGMQVCIDFHYSDFWADPKRQHAPKAWEGMTVEEKCDALYDFTKESLSEILDAGVDVGMVQIGNEINNGMSGETLLPNVMNLLASGSKAVREISAEYDKDIEIVVHYTNIEETEKINRIAMNLLNFGIDYDIFGLSFYTFWDGTFENMQTVAKNIQDTFGKKVVIAETSYCYTSEDGDGCGNSFKGTDDLVDGYAATVQSQATMIRDVCAAAHEAGVLGMFYWEGAWTPVGEATADNSPIWEKYGSGWASSFAADYDPDDAGLYYGGNAWDNQAMFDFDGYPLESLRVFKYLEHGTTASEAVDSVPDCYAAIDVGAELVLPEQVDVIYNNRALNKKVDVTWNEAELAAIDTNIGGEYTVTGTIEDGTIVTCHIDVIMMNYVQNPSFEDADTSMWNVTYAGENNPTDFQLKTDDAYTGDVAFHFWSEQDMEFAIEQELTDLTPGTYVLEAFAQGGDMADDATMEMYVVVNGEEQTVPFMVTTYADWKNPTISDIKITDGAIKFGVRIKCNAKSWGTVDDFTLNRISD